MEVQKYLNGECISQANLYRICYLMAKWHKEKGLTKLQIRDAIFEWGKKYGVYIKYSVNKIINCATADKRRLVNNISISVGGEDIAEINRRFDKPKVKLVALAVLCYAKAFADGSGDFTISSAELGAWVRIDGSLIRKIYLKELIEFEYVELVEQRKNGFRWDDTSTSRANRYRMCVPLHYVSNLVLMDNDIIDLCHRAF